jgi:hypothetical protein
MTPPVACYERTHDPGFPGAPVHAPVHARRPVSVIAVTLRKRLHSLRVMTWPDGTRPAPGQKSGLPVDRSLRCDTWPDLR